MSVDTSMPPVIPLLYEASWLVIERNFLLEVSVQPCQFAYQKRGWVFTIPLCAWTVLSKWHWGGKESIDESLKKLEMMVKCWVAMDFRCRSTGWGMASCTCKATGGFAGRVRHMHFSCCIVAWFLCWLGNLWLRSNKPAVCICSRGWGAKRTCSSKMREDNGKAKFLQVLPTNSVCIDISEFAKKNKQTMRMVWIASICSCKCYSKS